MDVKFKVVEDGKACWDLRGRRWDWDPPADETLIATLQERPIAVARAFHGKTLESVSCSMHVVGIGGVWVDPEHRGSGVASQLMRFCVDRFPIVVLFSVRRTLYERSGFVAIGEVGNESLWVADTSSGIRFNHSGWTLCPADHF